MNIIVLSGPIASGKSTLAAGLSGRFGCEHTRTRDLLLSHARGKVAPDRLALQKYGERLDRRTGGQWLAEELAKRINDLQDNDVIVVDSVRLQLQVDALRTAFGRLVIHVHLTAPREELAKRYEGRGHDGLIEVPTYDDLVKNKTEARIEELQTDADIVIDTTRNRPEDVLSRVSSTFTSQGPQSRQCVDVVVGGQYGSEGKGNIAFYLAREYGLLVRVGGPNAGHRVPYDNPITHRMLPSGTMAAPDAELLIGAGAVVDVPLLLDEIASCQIGTGRLKIDPLAMVISEEDKTDETRLVGRIGSTGSGVGMATARRVGRGEDVRLARDVSDLGPFIAPSLEILASAYSAGTKILLEGTQGTGLSLLQGDYPNVTSRDTTVSGCLAEAGIPPQRVRRVVMVCRTYPIRVKNPKGSTSGFLAQEIDWNEISTRSGVPYEELLEVERGSVSGNLRRVGEFDWDLLRRSVVLNSPTDIALTFVDYLDIENRRARRFEQLGNESIKFVQDVERAAGAPVSLISTRFHVRSVIDRRAW